MVSVRTLGQVAGTDGVVDLVGGLSAMGVLDMNAADCSDGSDGFELHACL